MGKEAKKSEYVFVPYTDSLHYSVKTNTTLFLYKKNYPEWYCIETTVPIHKYFIGSPWWTGRIEFFLSKRIKLQL